MQQKEYLIELMLCSSIQQRIRAKFAIINYPTMLDPSY